VKPHIWYIDGQWWCGHKRLAQHMYAGWRSRLFGEEISCGSSMFEAFENWRARVWAW